MINKSILLIGLIILNWNSVQGDDSACRLFYSKLSKLPHNELTVNTNGFVSSWDGKQRDGCEVIFEADESMVTGEVVRQKFNSFKSLQGWSINEKYIADGPGSSTVGIEDDQNICILNWSQHSWIDETINEIKQSDQIRMTIQCLSKLSE